MHICNTPHTCCCNTPHACFEFRQSNPNRFWCDVRSKIRAWPTHASRRITRTSSSSTITRDSCSVTVPNPAPRFRALHRAHTSHPPASFDAHALSRSRCGKRACNCAPVRKICRSSDSIWHSICACMCVRACVRACRCLRAFRAVARWQGRSRAQDSHFCRIAVTWTEYSPQTQ